MQSARRDFPAVIALVPTSATACSNNSVPVPATAIAPPEIPVCCKSAGIVRAQPLDIARAPAIPTAPGTAASISVQTPSVVTANSRGTIASATTTARQSSPVRMGDASSAATAPPPPAAPAATFSNLRPRPEVKKGKHAAVTKALVVFSLSLLGCCRVCPRALHQRQLSCAEARRRPGFPALVPGLGASGSVAVFTSGCQSRR